MGSGEFAAAILEKLAGSEFKPTAIFTQPDKPVGRRQELSPSPAKIIAQKFGLKIYEPKGLKNDVAEKLIKSLSPDLIVVADYGKIIPKNILDIPKLGALNIHPSLLPRHRGATPIQYTILEGDKETGVTIILMDEQVDHGAIVASEKLKVKSDELTFSKLFNELAGLGGNLLLNTLPRWLNGEIKPTPQDETQATYTKILAREDGKIDWQKSAVESERQIRAFEKWPGTWCVWPKENKKIKILKAEIFEDSSIGPAGKISLSPKGDMVITTGKGILKINELQLEGKNKTTGTEFLRGHPKILGTILS